MANGQHSQASRQLANVRLELRTNKKRGSLRPITGNERTELIRKRLDLRDCYETHQQAISLNVGYV
jgi:hypothetical protein